MRVGAFQFNPSWVATLATAPVLALLLWLGSWQLDRADTKQLLIDAEATFATAAPINVATIAPDERLPRHQRIIATGRYLNERQFLLDNRTFHGQAGYYVLTPLQLSDGTVLMINRGWLPSGYDRTVLPDITISDPDRAVTVSGRVHHPAEAQLLLGPSGYAQEGWPRLVQRFEFAATSDALARTTRPFTVRLDPQSPHGYRREWPVHYGITPDRHRAYAFQWFSLATALVTIYIVVNTRKVIAS